ncbi:MAG: adenosine deaminase family protein, partial [Myxococcota bacterium]
LEVRFAPQLHSRPGLDMAQVLLHVNQGLARAKAEFNRFPAIQSGQEPPFEYGIITCAMRMFTRNFSEYFKRLVDVHPHTSKTRLFGLASTSLAEAIVSIKREYDLPIVGFDLAGQEDGYPAEDHRQAYQYAHRHFMSKTVHAGEAFGPESIFQAITQLHADRIGHGYHLFSQDRIQNPKITDTASYVHQLAQYIAERRITIEVCLTSNMQTMPELKEMSQHALRKMLDAKLSVTLCTDNRTVSNTTMTQELALAVKHFQLTPHQLRHLVIYGFKRSFFPQDYIGKRSYVRQVIDYYESMEKKHNIQRDDDPSESSVELPEVN